jgi:tRNA A37 threonylcarbamoyladenosine biosynthesis protein TsaE
MYTQNEANLKIAWDQVSVVLMEWEHQIKTDLSSRKINIVLAFPCFETETDTHYMMRQTPELYNWKAKTQNKNN